MIQIILLLFPLIFMAKNIIGTVVDNNSNTIAFAEVGIAATDCFTQSNINGKFELICEKSRLNKTLTASKNGYLINGVVLKNKIYDYKIILEKVPNSDNANYKWIPSIDKKNEKACQNCHQRMTSQWQKSAHGSTMHNKTFKTIYNSIYKDDFKSSDGNCASCHQPIGENESISCDFCHKVYRVNPKKNLTGTLVMELRRPHNGEKNILFGSVKDAYTRDDSYSPLYENSKYCASCHSGHFWGDEVYSEYSQWQNSSYSKQGISCQKCHMPPQMDETFIVPIEKGGLKRSSGAYHSHSFIGSKDIEFMKKALDINVSIKKDMNVLVKLENIGAGHSFPTGSPLHHLLLLIDAKDCENKELIDTNGDKLPPWSTKVQRNGSIFAKVYRSSLAYTQNSTHFKSLYPNPYWRPSQLEYDSRLKANAPVLKHFAFNKKIKSVTITLIYRRLYLSWAKKLNTDIDDDIILYQKTLKGSQCN